MPLVLIGDVFPRLPALESVSVDAAASDYLHQLFISRALITDHTADALREGNGLNVAAGGDHSSSCLLPSQTVSPHLRELACETQ